MKPTKTQIVLGLLAGLFIVLASAETPDSWPFTYFAIYHFGFVGLSLLCLFLCGIFNRGNDEN